MREAKPGTQISLADCGARRTGQGKAVVTLPIPSEIYTEN